MRRRAEPSWQTSCVLSRAKPMLLVAPEELERTADALRTKSCKNAHQTPLHTPQHTHFLLVNINLKKVKIYIAIDLEVDHLRAFYSI